jgi:hypothetical protein
MSFLFVFVISSSQSPYTSEDCLECISTLSKYIFLLKSTLTGWSLQTPSLLPQTRDNAHSNKVKHLMPFSKTARYSGADCPSLGYSYTGMQHLDYLHLVLDKVVTLNVQGSYTACGVWRGGSAIFARLYFNAIGLIDARRVNVLDAVDSVGSLYAVDNYAAEPRTGAPSTWCRYRTPNVFKERDLWENFFKFDITMHDNVRVYNDKYNNSADYLVNNDALDSTDSTIAVLHIDEMSYEACEQIMTKLFPLVNSGCGFLIVENWENEDYVGCRAAIELAIQHFQTKEMIVENNIMILMKQARLFGSIDGEFCSNEIVQEDFEAGETYLYDQADNEKEEEDYVRDVERLLNIPSK